MAVHDGKLYVGYPAVYAFDGAKWEYVGTPAGRMPTRFLNRTQLHALAVYGGELHAGLWPEARVVAYKGGEHWEDRGRVGEDGTEVNSLAVYNGKFYGGSLPRAEVCRYDGGSRWTSLKRFFSPPGWTPLPPASPPSTPDRRKRVNQWTRLTGLTVYDGKLHASIGSCTSSILDAPCDVRGRVFRMEAGKCVSYDDDLGPGWKHITAVKQQGQLRLYVSGKLVATSSCFDPADDDISNDQPLKIGFGEMDYFSGKIKEVRLYRTALSDSEVKILSPENLPR